MKIKGKVYKTPIFLPDATRAVVKALDSNDLQSAGVKGVVVNTYHLMDRPGLDFVQSAGGIKKFMNFHKLVVSDSGGWQIFSLIHRNKKVGKITDEGVTFSIGDIRNKLFTPENAIEAQFKIGADIMICLDDFTPPNADKETIKKSVERTIHWAERSKRKYLEILKKEKISKAKRPLLFAVIQGDADKEMRKQCAEALLDIGFDGYGFGGYPIDKKTGKLDLEIAEYLSNLIPNKYPKFALGIGTPKDIISCVKFGWTMFDCTLPTRDARHKRLYVFENDPKRCKYLRINKTEYKKDMKPISKNCDCHTCQNYSRAYLHYLFKINDILAERLASIHNLRTYTRIVESLNR